VVQKILLRAYVSTLLVRAYQPMSHGLTDLRYQRPFVTLDCSQRAENALAPARLLAVFFEAPLSLVHVVQKPELPRREPPSQPDIELAHQLTKRNREAATNYFEHLRSRLASEGIDVQTHLLVGDNVAETLHELVEEQQADLVMMSAHGYTGGRKWPFGSFATSFIAYGTAPLLIIQDLSPDEVAKTRAEQAAVEYKGH
jgi:nucleotide-binding universal stress UspA family protein